MHICEDILIHSGVSERYAISDFPVDMYTHKQKIGRARHRKTERTKDRNNFTRDRTSGKNNNARQKTDTQNKHQTDVASEN